MIVRQQVRLLYLSFIKKKPIFIRVMYHTAHIEGMDKFEKIDVLINNAEITADGFLVKMKDED
jgi:hypothetical protein